MNTYAQETQTLISSTVSVPVYADLVPESAPLPAIAWYNVSYQKPQRVVSGIKEPMIITQRVMIVVDVTNTEVFDDILNELEAIDNTQNSDFQQIEVFMVNMETVQPDSPVQRCMVDLVLTTH